MARNRTSFRGPNATSFKPGQSGNPKGRPPLITDIHALARPHAQAAIDALVRALSDPDRSIPAAIALLDRGFGRPPQAISAEFQAHVIVGGIDAPARPHSMAETEAWLERRRRELAEIAEAAAKARTH